jgi:ribosome maturation factor RimP
MLDTAAFMDETPFTLEVTSPGVDRPLTLPRHWTKNLTRLVKVTLQDGTVTIGRLTEFSESTATLVENIKGRIKTHQVNFTDIKRAVVEIEFNRKEEASALSDESSDE